jgi:hypothetical protein
LLDAPDNIGVRRDGRLLVPSSYEAAFIWQAK